MSNSLFDCPNVVTTLSAVTGRTTGVTVVDFEMVMGRLPLEGDAVPPL